MPLAGLILNRMHYTAVAEPFAAARAEAAADTLEAKNDPNLALTIAALRVHAEVASAAEHDARMAKRFSSAHPQVGLVAIPALTADVHDLEGLREIGQLLGGKAS